MSVAINVSTMPSLLDALTTGAISATVSAVLVLLGPVIGMIPGFRPQDTTRNTLMRILLYVLTVGTMLGLAWTQGIVIPTKALPDLLVAAAVGSGAVHLYYTSVKGKKAAKATPVDVQALAHEALQAAQALKPAA